MTILGIDEVGRGPLAGPLVMGGVILGDGAEKFAWFGELTDSKKIAVKKRERLAEAVNAEAPAKALGWVSAAEIDEVGMSAALRLGTRRVVEGIQKQGVSFNEIIIDGTVNFLKGTALEKYTTVLPKADFLIKEVSAASIIAKAARDHYMYEVAEKYPGYGFEKHVGYGTAQHRRAMVELGLCPEHRRCFKLKEAAGKNTTEVGQKAEDLVAEHLEGVGHQIVGRNCKGKRYEIDIVSVRQGKVYFTEVKYRSRQDRGSSVEMVTARKLEQMKFAAQCYLQYKKELSEYQPMLMVAGVDGAGKIELIEVR